MMKQLVRRALPPDPGIKEKAKFKGLARRHGLATGQDCRGDKDVVREA